EKLFSAALKDSNASYKHKEQIKKALQDLYRMFTQVPHGEDTALGVEHEINLYPGSRPFAEGTRRYSPEQNKFIDEKTKELLDRDVIVKGYGAWRSAVHLAKKKDGTWRFCIDYRKLNAMTIPDSFPIPNIDDMMDRLSG